MATRTAQPIEGQEGQRALRTFVARRTAGETLRVDGVNGDGSYVEMRIKGLEHTRLGLEDFLAQVYGEPCRVEIERVPRRHEDVATSALTRESEG